MAETVAKLRRETHTAYSEAASLRLRAAWLYYNQGMTQKDVAEKLGISRSTVIRLLDEAMKRSEVQIWINEGIEDFVALAGRLEAAYGLDEAVIIPCPEKASAESTAKAVGLALGQFLSEAVPNDATIGVGWGRLAFQLPPAAPGKLQGRLAARRYRRRAPDKPARLHLAAGERARRGMLHVPCAAAGGFG